MPSRCAAATALATSRRIGRPLVPLQWPPGGHDLFEGAAVDERHDDEWVGAVLPPLQNGEHVVVFEGRQRARFTTESLGILGIREHIAAKDLQGDVPTQLFVEGRPHRRLATLAQDAREQKPADPGAGLKVTHRATVGVRSCVRACDVRTTSSSGALTHLDGDLPPLSLPESPDAEHTA